MITVTNMTPDSATLVAGDTQINIQVISGKAVVSLSPLDKTNRAVSDYKAQYQSSTVQRRKNNAIPSDLAAKLDSLFI